MGLFWLQVDLNSAKRERKAYRLHKFRDKILDLRRAIAESEGIPQKEQILIFDGQHLEDDRWISDYQISELSLVHCIVSPHKKVKFEMVESIPKNKMDQLRALSKFTLSGSDGRQSLKRLQLEFAEQMPRLDQVDHYSTDGLTLLPFADTLGPHVQGVIKGPQGTPFAGGMFNVYIEISQIYPWTPPKLHMYTKIHHPNIDPRTGAVYGVPFSTHKWSINLTLRDCLFAIRKLLILPNMDAALEHCLEWNDVEKSHAQLFTELYARRIPLKWVQANHHLFPELFRQRITSLFLCLKQFGISQDIGWFICELLVPLPPEKLWEEILENDRESDYFDVRFANC